jgi:hypothetical protein
MEAEIYWHSRLRRWSIRVGGRIVNHVPAVTAYRCRMVVRQRAVMAGQRCVCAWVRGDAQDGVTLDNCAELVRIGFNPFLAPTFTTRPGYQPIYSARMVVFTGTGEAWALI